MCDFLFDVNVRYYPLEYHVEGVTLPNDDNTYDIYINSLICKEKQDAALKHELEHIAQNHLYDYNDVAIDELLANLVIKR